MSLSGIWSSGFYTQRAGILTMFVGKSVKMNSIACQLSVKQVLIASVWNFFCLSIIHPKKNYSKIYYFLMRFTNNNEKWSLFLEEVKYGVFRHLALYGFHFPLLEHIIRLHTYIIGHYNPSVRIIDLVSHTTYVVCVNFIHKWRDLQF